MSPSSHKIELDHLQRKAYIYIRQSSPQQVLHNRESQRRQYGLKERALALGWPASAVVEIDEDQAQTASQGERSGFQRLLRGVSQDEIGAIFNLEVSRLARQNSAWALLMELCRFQDVLLIDDQNIYDPSLPDDRLLLGIRGLLAETELDILNHRLQRSREAKAERGALRFRPPRGWYTTRAGDCASTRTRKCKAQCVCSLPSSSGWGQPWQWCAISTPRLYSSPPATMVVPGMGKWSGNR